MKKEPEVLTDASLTVLARGIGKEQLKGLEIAMYLNIPTTAIVNIINSTTTGFLTDEGSEGDRIAVTSECLQLWKKMTRESKTRDRVRDLERALKDIGKSELAELFAEYHQSGQEINDNIFQ
ncbi:unnamed protein product [Candidula unifasciata]|uniref:Uncharacterized protein n=1 Tax=Candidula unifasciata TaxID=100452 RepID=A0A8S3YN36_9EUPU|nr:unnamed protein product [Candidula unifasciata]